jgi:hypothetical protein
MSVTAIADAQDAGHRIPSPRPADSRSIRARARLLARILDLQHPRAQDPDTGRLREFLQLLQSENPSTLAVHAFLEGWDWINQAVLLDPHRFRLFFPGIAASHPQVLGYLGRFNTPAAARVSPEIESQRSRWLRSNSPTDSPGSLMGRLLQRLSNPRSAEEEVWGHVGCQLAFRDLMLAAFLEPGWRGLHDTIARLLDYQRRFWPETYCGGYAYQGLERIGISGCKPSGQRLAQYDIHEYLADHPTILDVGSNCGFFAVELSRHASMVHGIELNPYLNQLTACAASFLGVTNLRQVQQDFTTFWTQDRFDVVFSLSNHHTIDGNLALSFEEYVAKLYYLIAENGVLMFESHNIFGPGQGGPGDDGDLEQKFDIAERYFAIEKVKMVCAFVNEGDVDKLFVVLRRRPRVLARVDRTLRLDEVKSRYAYAG